MNLIEFKSRLSALPKEQSRAEITSFPGFRAGEIHDVKTDHDDFNMVIIVGTLDNELLVVSPLTLCGEYAGPDDLFLPVDSWGQEAVVLLECEFTIHTKTLTKCIARLAAQDCEYLLRAREAVETGVNRNLFNWGWEYIDEKDLSYQFHDTIVGCIENLQFLNWNALTDTDKGKTPICIQSIFQEISLPAAARSQSDSGYSRFLAVSGISIDKLKEHINIDYSEIVDVSNTHTSIISGNLNQGPVNTGSSSADISWDLSDQPHCLQALILDEDLNILGLAHAVEEFSERYLRIKEWFGVNKHKIESLSSLYLLAVWQK